MSRSGYRRLRLPRWDGERRNLGRLANDGIPAARDRHQQSNYGGKAIHLLLRNIKRLASDKAVTNAAVATVPALMPVDRSRVAPRTAPNI